jgi:hypothetical protein
MCCNKGLIKRIVPFFLTFAVGLFIASFFVTVAAPSFQFPNRGERRRHQERDRMMEFENQRLREENLRLKQNQFETEDMNVYDFSTDSLTAPPPVAPVRNNRK